MTAMFRRKQNLMREIIIALVAAAVVEALLATCTGPARLQLDIHVGAAVEQNEPRGSSPP